MDNSIYEQPEFLMEDVVSFTNWAYELIPEQFYHKNFNLTWIPDWPTYYSWVFQSMWHLLLNQISKDKSNIFLFFQELDDEKIFVLDYKKIFMWKKYKLWNFDNLNLESFPNVGLVDPEIYKDFQARFELQLPFTRIFGLSNEIYPVFVGKNVEMTYLLEFLFSIFQKKSDSDLKLGLYTWKVGYNMFFIDNLPAFKTYDQTLEKHQDFVNYILSGKSEEKELPFSVKLFHQISKLTNKNPEVINYINENYFSGNKKWGIWYMCLVG